MRADLEEPRYDVGQKLQQRVLDDALDDLGLHLDGRQVDGVVGRLHNRTQHLGALLRVDGACQGGGRLLCRPHHLWGKGAGSRVQARGGKHEAMAIKARAASNLNASSPRWGGREPLTSL